MDALTRVFLSNLELHHHLRLLQAKEEGRYRFTRLEINWTILDLDDDVVSELSIKMDKLFVRPIGTVTLISTLSRCLLNITWSLG